MLSGYLIAKGKMDIKLFEVAKTANDKIIQHNTLVLHKTVQGLEDSLAP